MAVKDRPTKKVSKKYDIVEDMKTDKEFMEGIKRGVKACREGKARRWSDIKKELGLR